MFLSRNISVTVGRRGNCVEVILLNNHLTLFNLLTSPPPPLPPPPPHPGGRKFLTTLQYIFSYSVIHLGFVFKSPPQYSLDYLYQIQLSPKEHHTAGPFPCKRRWWGTPCRSFYLGPQACSTTRARYLSRALVRLSSQPTAHLCPSRQGPPTSPHLSL